MCKKKTIEGINVFNLNGIALSKYDKILILILLTTTTAFFFHFFSFLFLYDTRALIFLRIRKSVIQQKGQTWENKLESYAR